MNDPIKLTGCSMGCAYAEGGLEKCQCKCNGSMHGMLVQVVAAICSKGQEKKCKSGEEEGDCACACGGMNHGLYSHIEHWEGVRITGYKI